MISKPSQKSRTLTSEIIAQFRQFTKSTSWSPNSWLKASGFQSSDLSFLCTPETSTGCGNKNVPMRVGTLLALWLSNRIGWFPGDLFSTKIYYCFPGLSFMDSNKSANKNGTSFFPFFSFLCNWIAFIFIFFSIFILKFDPGCQAIELVSFALGKGKKANKPTLRRLPYIENDKLVISPSLKHLLNDKHKEESSAHHHNVYP